MWITLGRGRLGRDVEWPAGPRRGAACQAATPEDVGVESTRKKRGENPWEPQHLTGPDLCLALIAVFLFL